MPSARHSCTYFDSNYLVRALPMLESLARYCGEEYRLFTLCLDDKEFRMVFAE